MYVGPNCRAKFSHESFTMFGFELHMINAGATCDRASSHSSARFCKFTDPTTKAARITLYWRMGGGRVRGLHHPHGLLRGKQKQA